MFCHKIGKIPDELSDDIFLPLLVEDGMIFLQYGCLVFLREHKGRVLKALGKREKAEALDGKRYS